MRLYWQRTRDGVIVYTGTNYANDPAPIQTLATRTDNGHVFWVSWAGLTRNYTQIERPA